MASTELCTISHSGKKTGLERHLKVWDRLFKTNDFVNVSLNFQKLVSQICQYFLLKKCEKLLQCKSFSHFFNKKFFSVFGHKVIKHLMS